MNRDRICYGKSVFKGPETRGSGFAAEEPQTSALSGGQARQVAIKVSREAREQVTFLGRVHCPKSKGFNAVRDLENRLSLIDYETSFGSVGSQRAKRMVDWLEVERCT